MKSYRLLTCLKCKHEFKSNLDAKNPHCSKCGSFDWIETKQLVNKNKLEKEIDRLKDYVLGLNSKVNQQKTLIDKLIDGHNNMYDAYQELKNTHPQQVKNKSVPGHPKEDRPLTISERLDAMR